MQRTRNIFSLRPQLCFYDTLDGQNAEFPRSCIDDIGKHNQSRQLIGTFEILSSTHIFYATRNLRTRANLDNLVQELIIYNSNLYIRENLFF